MILHDTKPTTERFFDSIMLKTPCDKHNAARGFPCWFVPTDIGLDREAICNHRAIKAGFNAAIDPRSLVRAKGRKRG